MNNNVTVIKEEIEIFKNQNEIRLGDTFKVEIKKDEESSAIQENNDVNENPPIDQSISLPMEILNSIKTFSLNQINKLISHFKNRIIYDFSSFNEKSHQFSKDHIDIAKESKRIVNQIIMQAEKNFKRIIYAHRHIGIQVKKYKNLEEYKIDHKEVTKLFMSYILDGTVYKKEMKKDLKQIMSVMEDKVIFYYLRTLRKGLKDSKLNSIWKDEDDLQVLGYKIENEVEQESGIEIMRFNVTGEKDEKDEKGEKDEKHLKICSKQKNEKCYLDLIKELEDPFTIHRSQELLRDLVTFSYFSDNKIIGFFHYEKFGFFSNILEKIYPILKNTSNDNSDCSFIRSKFFSKKTGMQVRMAADAINNYDFFRNEAKRIVKKYKSFKDLYPYEIHQCQYEKLSEGRKSELEISLDAKYNPGLKKSNLKNNDFDFDLECPIQLKTRDLINGERNGFEISIEKRMDFLKILFFLKLFVYSYGCGDLAGFSDEMDAERWLRSLLENDEQNNYEIALRTLAKHLRIRFNVFDARKDENHLEAYFLENANFVISLMKINESNYLLLEEDSKKSREKIKTETKTENKREHKTENKKEKTSKNSRGVKTSKQ